MTKNKDNIDAWIKIALGILAVFAIKSIFEHDNSKIISKKGTKMLEDEDKMDEINKKLNSLEENGESHKEIVI